MAGLHSDCATRVFCDTPHWLLTRQRNGRLTGQFQPPNCRGSKCGVVQRTRGARGTCGQVRRTSTASASLVTCHARTVC